MTDRKDIPRSREEERLGPRSNALVEYDERSYRTRLIRRFGAASLVDLAHSVMLVDRGIVALVSGARLIDGLLQIQALGPERFPWLPDSGSYLTQVERFLDADSAALLQTGRSRLDQAAATERLYQRDMFLNIADAVAALTKTTIDLAERHAALVMPGYTHLQHAQPWTFGHYLMRQAFILLRDLERLAEAYRRTNLSALGGAAGAGTSFAIDRRRVAALLGHDDLVLNASDAGGFARDFIEENTAVLSILMANLGRFATDLYVWHAHEFAMVEIADGLAGTSSIMPQKKNPNALEHVKAIAGQAVGWLATIMGNQRGVLSSDVDYSFGDDLFGGYVERSHGAVRLMTETVATLIVKPARMEALAAAGWSTTSHLADVLAREHGLPHRTAHQVVARFARAMAAGNRAPAESQATPLLEAARDIAGVTLKLDDAAVRRLLDPRHFVETRVSEGSIAPDDVRRQAAAARDALARIQAQLTERRTAASAAIDSLLARARELAATPA